MEPFFAVRWLTIYSYYRIYASMKMNIDIMEAAADRASDLLKALANRHRLLIVCQLIDGERSVGDLAEFLGLRDSTVSQHLALASQGWPGFRPARCPDDLLFDRQRSRARNSDRALSRVLHAAERQGLAKESYAGVSCDVLRQVNDRAGNADKITSDSRSGHS